MITLIHPSYGRPQMAFKAFSEWLQKSTGDFEYILSLDSRDKTIPEYQKLFKPELIHISDSVNCVQSTNEAAKISTGDILIYLSDDFSCPDKWDKKVSDALDPNKLQLLKVHDNLQPFKNTVLTIPIMTRALYNDLGYFWHPEYESIWVDVDLWYACAKHKAGNVIVERKDLVFPHNHYSKKGNGYYDGTGKQHDNTQRWNDGKALINRMSIANGWYRQF